MFAARAASRMSMVSSIRVGAAATVARTPPAAARVQKRTMAGGLGEYRPKLVYTGFEKTVRDRLPEDYQLVIAVVGMYIGLYGVYKVTKVVFPSKAPEEPVIAGAPPSSTQSGEIPEGEEFYTWVDQPGNLEKYLATWEQD